MDKKTVTENLQAKTNKDKNKLWFFVVVAVIIILQNKNIMSLGFYDQTILLTKKRRKNTGHSKIV